MAIALIGYRGSGKTTVGRLLAARLGHDFVDTDDLIIRRAGKSIREIFEQHGEAVFRDYESDAVANVSGLGNSVIAFGGGAMDREKNRIAFATRKHHLIHLRCEPDELLRRISADPNTAANRPNLTQLVGGLEEIRTVLARREPIWKQIQTAEVDVTALTVEEVAEWVVALHRT